MVKEKLAPHDIPAEEGVIGSLLIDSEAIKEIKFLIPEDFYHEPLRELYAACVDLWHRGMKIDSITLGNEMERRGKLADCGGVPYLSHLIATVPTSLDIDSYAQIVRNLSISRQLIYLGTQCVEIGQKSDPDNVKNIGKVYDLITDFKKKNMPLKGLISPKDSSDIMFDLLDKYNEPSHAIGWGYRVLDEITSGIYPAELTVIGARPSVGKTQLMIDIAENVARQGKTILFASVEMAIRALMERRVARELNLSVLELRKRGLTPDEQDKLVNLIGKNSEHSIYYLADGTSSQDVFNEAQKLKDNIGLDIIFIDYLQFLTDCWQNDRENMNVRVGKVCKTLKTIANELQIPVIVASQLSRALEHRGAEDRHPTLADLRDSGNIEQDADVVLLLDREVIYDDAGRIVDDTTLQVKMAKNRQMGSAAPVKLKFNLKTRRYQDISDGEIR